MSQKYELSTPLRVETRSIYGALALIPVGIWLTVFVLGWAIIFRVVENQSQMFGIELFQLLAITLVVTGTIVVGLGLSSRFDYMESTPSNSSGLLVTGWFGLLGFITVGLAASQTIGLEGLLWLFPASVAAVALGGFVAVTREDIGSTIPAGLFALFVGVVFLTGMIGPDWQWSPEGFGVVFSGTITIPAVAIVASLVVAWAAAKARAGFGSRGQQAGAYLLIGMNALAMLGILLLLVVFTFSQGYGVVFDGIEIGPGLHFYWPFVMDSFDIVLDENGIFPSIVGTFWLVVGSFLFAVPTGVGAAVFLTEYAEQGRFTSVIEIATNGLWSTPSIVFGLFGYAFLVPRLGNNVSLLAGMITLGFMLLPLVLITSREAIKSVPDGYRDASAALGVTKWETIKSIVIPAAMPGILTGIILGIGRIAGETAPILLVTAGGLQSARAPDVLGSFQLTTAPPFIQNPALLEGASALPYQLYASITAGVVSDNPQYGWGVALVLLLMVMTFYAVGIGSRIYFRRKLSQQ